MEAKHQKVHFTPSIFGIVMNFLHALNSLKKERPTPYKCYVCNEEYSKDHFQNTNQKFASFSPSKFAFIVENLGLSRLELLPEFITEGSINICSKCLLNAEQAYDSPWI